MKIAIDLDGVIYDYASHYAEWKYYHPEVEFPQSQEEFWTTMPLIPGALKAVITLMMEHDVYFLTAPSYLNPACYSGKRIAIEQTFGLEASKRLVIMHDKSNFLADILIDDNFDTNGQDKFIGQLIIHKDWETTVKELDEYINLV